MSQPDVFPEPGGVPGGGTVAGTLGAMAAGGAP